MRITLHLDGKLLVVGAMYHVSYPIDNRIANDVFVLDRITLPISFLITDIIEFDGELITHEEIREQEGADDIFITMVRTGRTSMSIRSVHIGMYSHAKF